MRNSVHQLGDDFTIARVPVHTNHRISWTLQTRYYFSSKLIQYHIQASLRRDHDDPPDGWRTFESVTGAQFVADELPPVPEFDRVELGPDDAEETFALARATDPDGPFGVRTSDMGRYVGVRRDGELVAMAGERLAYDRGLGRVRRRACETTEGRRGLARALD